jgi:prepilin-type N-terminal cleavage/methylation domain-containing protein
MRTARGFTLVEILVVLIIFAVVLAMAAAITRGVAASQKRSITATRMAAIDNALLQFISVSKRLPCPADGRLLSTDANAGVENPAGGANCNAQQHGVIPWRTLGLSEADGTDGWDRRFTYRLPAGFGVAGALDMSWCDPASTAAVAATAACSTACASVALASCTAPQSYLLNKGIEIRSRAGAIVMNPAGAPATGAAYVVISPGESGGGGYFFGSGVLSASSTTDGTEEVKNYANVAGNPAAYYVDDSLNEIAGAAHFDDVVSRPSVLSVLNKAGLGPRSH